MEYVSITKTIRGHYANMKFWFMSWLKNKNADLEAQIKKAIATLKELVTLLLTVIGDNDERESAAKISLEVIQIETALES